MKHLKLKLDRANVFAWQTVVFSCVAGCFSLGSRSFKRVKQNMSEPPSFTARQWSSQTLMRGMSFLKDQKNKEKMEYSDILAATRLSYG